MRSAFKRLSCVLTAASALTLVGASVAAESGLRVRSVELVALSPSKALLRIGTSGQPRYLTRVEDGGAKLVLELEGAPLDEQARLVPKGSDLVSGIVAEQLGDSTLPRTRLTLSLAHPSAYQLVSEAGALRLELERSDHTVERGGVPAPAGSVTDVRFQHEEGRDVVRIAVPESIVVEPTSVEGKTVVDFIGAGLAPEQERTLDVSAFGGSVRSISTFQSASVVGRVRIEIERDAHSSVRTSREGSAYIVTCEPLASTLHTVPPVAALPAGTAPDGGIARRTRTVAREEPSAPPATAREEGVTSARQSQRDTDQAGAFLPTVAAQAAGKRFNGRRIDLDLKDADILNVLRFLSDVGRVNIVTSDNVSGAVTIRMRNVPWDQAMETILQAKGLGLARQGNLVRVAPIADLNKERELAIARRKSELQLAPVETRLIPVSYATAEGLAARAKELLSPRGSLSVDERTNVLIGRDIAGNLNQVEELVRSLDTQTPQVLIEARIVEATSRYFRDVGVQWGGDATMSATTGNATGLAFPSAVGLAGGASDGQAPTAGLSPFSTTFSNPNFAVNLPAAVGTGQGGAVGFTFGSINNTVNLALRLSAAESSGTVRIVSSPRVLTLDNREARISQGTLIPFSQVSAQGVQTTFQNAQLQLMVKPHVTADGSVSMTVKINRDEPDFNQTSARGEPTILKREAETELLVLDGHTAVIGGIFTRNTGRNIDQVPILGDLPILGVLFQHRKASDIRGELVIFLTPRIVNRAEALGR